jgi:hypothetical protein
MCHLFSLGKLERCVFYQQIFKFICVMVITYYVEKILKIYGNNCEKVMRK